VLRRADGWITPRVARRGIESGTDELVTECECRRRVACLIPFGWHVCCSEQTLSRAARCGVRGLVVVACAPAGA
jgi:hypothetical protein